MIDTLHENHPEFFPNQSLRIILQDHLNDFLQLFYFFQDYANFLLKSVDLWSPDEYLNYYKKPINVILDSGIYFFKSLIY